jgi:hypothetical protein
MANPLKITCFDPERLASSAQGCTGTADLAQARELPEPLRGECPFARYLEEGR